MQIVPRNGSLAYRLKHFDGDLTAWEDKAEVEDFPLVAIERDAIHFAGLSFYRRGEDRLRSVVKIGRKDGSTAELAFDYVRVR